VIAASSSYKGHRYPGEIIAHSAWLYHPTHISCCMRLISRTMPPRAQAGELPASSEDGYQCAYRGGTAPCLITLSTKETAS
jgi:hypothetical protein